MDHYYSKHYQNNQISAEHENKSASETITTIYLSTSVVQRKLHIFNRTMFHASSNIFRQPINGCFCHLSLINFFSIWCTVSRTHTWFGPSTGGIWTPPCRLLETQHLRSRCPRRPRHRHTPHTPVARQSHPVRTRPRPPSVTMSPCVSLKTFQFHTTVAVELL